MRHIRMTGWAVLCAGLAACSSGSVQETLGLDRNAPDEFKVVSRPPLAVPPEFNLRPPGDTSGAAASVLPVHRKAESLIRSEAEDGVYALPSDTRTASLPVERSRPVQTDSAEAQFLRNAGADRARADIRESLIEERVTRQIADEEKGWWDSMWSWTDEESEPVIDAQGESERILTNQEQGKPVNEGEVVDSDTQRSTWDKIFGD